MSVELESLVQKFARELGIEDYRKLEQVLLDGHEIVSLGSLEFLKEMPNLEVLSLNFCRIKGLQEPFPAGLPLERLELSDNDLCKADLEKLANLQNLFALHLNETKIENADDLEPLKALQELRFLYLVQTPLSRNENYLADVFALLPQLEYIDDCDKDGNTVYFSDSSDSSLSMDEQEQDSFMFWGGDEEVEEEDNQEYTTHVVLDSLISDDDNSDGTDNS